MENIIISLGGSLIVPKEGVNVEFLKKFNTFIRWQIKNRQRRFFIVCGGGAVARNYQNAAKEAIGKIDDEDVDWLGIHATRLNAHLLRTIFRDIAYFRVKKHYDQKDEVKEKVAICSGWKPGWSTDFDAVILAEEYRGKLVLNLSNIDGVYDKDPRKFSSAKVLPHLTWPEYRLMVGDKWDPGMNVPFDPVASKKAQEMGLRVVVLNGCDVINVERCLDGLEFLGTVIE